MHTIRKDYTVLGNWATFWLSVHSAVSKLSGGCAVSGLSVGMPSLTVYFMSFRLTANQYCTILIIKVAFAQGLCNFWRQSHN